MQWNILNCGLDLLFFYTYSYAVTLICFIYYCKYCAYLDHQYILYIFHFLVSVVRLVYLVPPRKKWAVINCTQRSHVFFNLENSLMHTTCITNIMIESFDSCDANLGNKSTTLEWIHSWLLVEEIWPLLIRIVHPCLKHI